MIKQYRWRDDRGANYRLLEQKLNMGITTTRYYELPANQEWENEGGAVIHPEPIVESVEQVNKVMMRLRGSRKQRAARAYVPKESIKVVPSLVVAPQEVVMTRLAGKDESDKVALLEEKIKILQRAIEQKRTQEAKLEAAKQALSSLFDAKRLK